MTDEHRDKPDLTSGISETDLADGALLVDRVGDQEVPLSRCGREIFAIGAACTHYGGPLGEGLLIEDAVRCPWHHACFSLRTGETLAAPALNATSCWQFERRGDRIFFETRYRTRVGRCRPDHERRPARPVQW
jgi:apoptosis-inducing factor 3